MKGNNTRRLIPLVSAALTIVGGVIASKLSASLSSSQSLAIVLGWVAAGIIVTYSLSRLQARSQEQSPEAIKERVSQLEPELRKQVQARSYGTRRQLIEAPLRELELDITPRLGWVRDPRLIEPEPLSKKKAAEDIIAAFESSKRRMLIVGEPGSGKTMAAYSLIEYLDNTEGAERIPLLVNLSAWEAQDDFESFLVDYLCSSVGYEVHERALASAFISSGRYNLILDGLDEIPAELREHFSERLDAFVGGLPNEVDVIVTCRTQEYEQLLAAHPTGLGLVQAVEILPLTNEQLDSAFVELAKRDEAWEDFLSQRDHTAYQRVRELLSNPLFLNLAVVGRLSPGQLLDWSTTQQELQDLVLDSYLDRTLANQRQYEPEAARRYLSWIANFLNGAEVSPFGLREKDFTVFDLADLTPPEPPRRHWLFGALAVGIVLGMILAVGWALVMTLVAEPRLGMVSAMVSEMGLGQVSGLGLGLILALSYGLTFWPLLVIVLTVGLGLRVGRPLKRSAVSTRLTLVWPSTRQQLRDFLRRAGRGLMFGLVLALVLGLGLALFYALAYGPGFGLILGMVEGLGLGLILGMVLALGSGLLVTRSVLTTSRTPKEASARSVTAALTWLVCGVLGGLVAILSFELVFRQGFGRVESLYRGTGPVDFGLVEGLYRDMQTFLGIELVFGLVFGLAYGLILALRNGGWFVLLQRAAHRRLARAGTFPSHPYDFLEWGIEQQIFRRVGGGVRFRHNLIQQHLGKAPQQQPREAEARSETRGPKLVLAGVLLVLAVVDAGLVGLASNNDLGWGLVWAIRDLLALAVIILAVSGVVYLFLRRRQEVAFQEAIFSWPRGPKLGLAVAFLALAVWDTAAFALVWTIRDLLRLAVIILVASGVVYLFLRRRQEVAFQEAIFSWPMAAVAGVGAFLLQFWLV